jgi:gamma-glutamyltranspeptidase/glutathione hydrolase
MIRVARRAFAALVLIVAVATPLGAQDARLPAPAGATPVTARAGMVVAQEAHAARVGVDILRKGGNAIDAAVAVGFALAVTYPRAGNLGGGGFMLIHLAKSKQTVAIDYRETAPAATTRDIFLGAHGEADPAKSRDSGLAVGVPGTVAGLALAHARYGSGKFNLAQLIAPAIAFTKGIPVADDTAESLPRAEPRLAGWPASAKIFLKADGTALRAGDTLVQRDLAATLRAIAYNGPSAFYRGPIAEKIVASVRAAGGLMTLDDLANYRAVARMPVRNTYRDYDIVSMPPPSSGGVQLIEMLNVLEGYPLGELDTVASLHLMVEAMKRAYADRAEFLGDPDVVSNPSGLIAKRYAAAVRATIDPQRARPSADIQAGDPSPREGGNTTHFSIVDRFGNAVANTTTLNFSYGLGMVADGTGVLLNNELDDFAAKPGTPNAFGLVGGEANAPGPGKRPLSSMTPTIVFQDGKPFLVTGSPGGSRIPTAVLQVIVNVIDHRKNVAEAVAAPRIHHQWLPDELRAERELANEIVHGLEQRGHRIMFPLAQTSANSILVTKDGLAGAADPRTRGALAAGY